MNTRSASATLESLDDAAFVGAPEQVLAQLTSVGRAVVLTLGENLAEVVIHDFSSPENSIVFIAGNVTMRKAGGSMSQIGLAMIAEGDAAEDKINYITRTRNGKVLKSSTVALRDHDGRVWGAFCLNVDVTGVLALEHTLRELVSGSDSKVVSNIHFGNDTAEVARVMLDEVLQQLEFVGPPREVEQCLSLVGTLEKRGFFAIRYSVLLLAEYLGVSRTTVYNYLERSRDS